MSNMASLPVWIALLEVKFDNNSRAAAAHYGIDPAYWWRLKSGEKSNPSQEVLDKLGLREAAVLYEVTS